MLLNKKKEIMIMSEQIKVMKHMYSYFHNMFVSLDFIIELYLNLVGRVVPAAL